jgi:membrane protease YdiL (CAAX protease family)
MGWAEMNRELKHALYAFAGASVAVVLLARVGGMVPLIANNLGALVAVVFLYTPFLVARYRRDDMLEYGFAFAPVKRGLKFGLAVPLLIFPAFAGLFVVFYEIVCEPGSGLASLAPPGICRSFRGWDGIRFPPLGLDFAELALVQFVVIALPEELLFRGCIHQLLEKAFPPKKRVLGGGIGWALVISSALFAIGHLAVAFDPRRLAVFFPGLLFGWMRSATGSIFAGVIAHATSNLFIYVLERMYF